jgi:2-methylisocitrate lyase-like PEP mutase family enzyme
LEGIGFSLVIFPGGIDRALAKSATDYYGSLAVNGSNQPFRDRMFDFNALNDVLGTPELIARGKSFELANLGRKA